MTATIPKTPFALLSGSAGWGIRFPDDLAEPGVTVLERDMSFDTPWGTVDHWQLIEVDASLTGDREPRRFLNVFSHGWPNDEIDNSAHRRVAWVLQQAGVKKVLADSTCGSLNKAVQPQLVTKFTRIFLLHLRDTLDQNRLRKPIRARWPVRFYTIH